MLPFVPAGTARRHLFTPVLVLMIAFFLPACGRGTHKNPTSEMVSPTSRQPSAGKPVVTGGIKIGVSEDRLCEITSTDIKNLIPGWKNVDPTDLQLTLRGKAQPMWISTQGENFRIIFYGFPSDSRYTGENIYMLAGVNGKQLLMGEKQAPEVNASPSPSESFLSSIRIEENNIYAPQAIDGDHFFWLSLPGRKKQNIEVEIPRVANGGGILRVAVWGSTESPEEYDHHMIISLNDQILIDEKWDGAGRRTLEADIPAGILKEGKNFVLIQAPGDTGAAAEINYVDWIGLDYPRQAEADHDFLAFEVTKELSGSPLHLRGFSGAIGVFDVTVPTETVKISSSSVGKELTFMGEVGHRYLAVGPNGIEKPNHLALPVLSPDLRASDFGADYVVIGPQDLILPLIPLLDWRTSQGLKVISIPLDAVYDQFTGGMPEPEAIRAFMTYAAKAWKPAPSYLLLVGDATYDPRGYLSLPEANRLPVIFVQTNFGGETASDVLLGDVDGDELPDLAVGRMPAQNADQVRILVQKTLAYEQSSTAGDWRTKVLAISDGQEASFQNDAQKFLGSVETPYQGILYAPEAGVKDAPVKVKAYFDEGFGLIAYFGHGSINMWGKDRIFMAEDVSSLSNLDRLPVVINMSCLTGLFIHPKVQSLMETLLWYDKGGAVAMLAPTSLTLPSSQSYLSQALIEAMMQNHNATLGEMYMLAQKKVPMGDAGAREVLLTFLLFGDPGLGFGIK